MKVKEERVTLQTAFCDCGSKLLFTKQKVLGMNGNPNPQVESEEKAHSVYVHICIRTGTEVELNYIYPRYPKGDNS